MNGASDSITGAAAQTPVNIQYYFVLLIDVLGQQQHLSRWNSLPEDGKITPELLEAVRKSAGVVAKLRRDLEVFFRAWLDAPRTSVDHQQAMLALPLGASRASYQSMSDSRHTVAHFSDTFVVYTPVTTSHGDWSVRALYSLLGCACMLSLLYLARRTPLRGAICIGAGAEFPEIGFYGPALAEAHHLEASTAAHPRIIVSANLRKFVRSLPKRKGEPNLDKAIHGMFERCGTLVAEDTDGECILDYLGAASRELFPGPTPPKRDSIKLVRAAYDFVIEEGARLSKAAIAEPSDENKNLAERYALLKDYFDQHVENWGITRIS